MLDGRMREIIHIIDDEPSLRRSLLNFFESTGREAISFDDASEFLAYARNGCTGCVLLDMNMPGMTGLELQVMLKRYGNSIPIIFMTGSTNISMSVSAMKGGAFDFLIKPFEPKIMVGVVDRAFEYDRSSRVQSGEMELLREKLQRLTPRETEVWHYVADGLMNKQIAFQMNISEIMVKLHRGRMMKKLDAKSVVDIVRMFDRLMPEGLLSRMTTTRTAA